MPLVSWGFLWVWAGRGAFPAQTLVGSAFAELRAVRRGAPYPNGLLVEIAPIGGRP